MKDSSKKSKTSPSDSERLDALEEMRKASGLTGKVILKMDPRGRGFCLREAMPFETGASFPSVRDALDDLLKTME